MNVIDDLSCGCGPIPHPPFPDIPAGLATLSARQLAGFTEYRQAMLSAIRTYTDLSDWRARGAGDLGIMLLEAWAYVLDVTGFYDARIAERSYLGTTPDQAGARRLTNLLGHRPRPAMAARVQIALEAEGADPLTLPVGTSFRSEPFNGEPPQIFELVTETIIWPERNRWQLAPVREDAFDGILRFLPRRGPNPGAVLILWTASEAAAAQIGAVVTETALDGANYLRAEFDADSASGMADLEGKKLGDIIIAIARLPVAQCPYTNAEEITSLSNPEPEFSRVIALDAFYPQVRPGSRAVAEINGVFHPVSITAASLLSVTVDTASGAKISVTQVTFTPALEDWTDGDAFTLHVNPVLIGKPTRPAKTAIELSDLTGSGTLVPPVTALNDAPSGGNVILLGAKKQGSLLAGSLIEEGDGVTRFVHDAAAGPFEASLTAPIEVFGNIAEAVRGETVIGEVLGSGNAAQPFNSFTLKKKPLTWVEDHGRPDGRRPELSIRVDDIEWERVDSFFGHGPQDRIYLVRQDEEGAATIFFGDGTTGARVPTGSANIQADYRFGAGVAKPPPGAVNQIAVPVRGLASVRAPLPAIGGADAETAAELRTDAPKSALTLGRAVSLADFEALARSYPGVLNATVGWGWDTRRQRAAVKLWIIADGGDPSRELVNWITGQAAIGLSLSAEQAGEASVSTLSITLEIAARHDPEIVRAAAFSALYETRTGLLAPVNVQIGKPLFRSVLTHRLHQVAGVASVVSVLLDGLPMIHAINPGAGKWFNLEAGTTLR